MIMMEILVNNFKIVVMIQLQFGGHQKQNHLSLKFKNNKVQHILHLQKLQLIRIFPKNQAKIMLKNNQ